MGKNYDAAVAYFDTLTSEEQARQIASRWDAHLRHMRDLDEADNLEIVVERALENARENGHDFSDSDAFAVAVDLTTYDPELEGYAVALIAGHVDTWQGKR